VVECFEMLGQLEGRVDVHELGDRWALSHILCFCARANATRRFCCAAWELVRVQRQAGRRGTALVFGNWRRRGQSGRRRGRDGGRHVVQRKGSVYAWIGVNSRMHKDNCYSAVGSCVVGAAVTCLALGVFGLMLGEAERQLKRVAYRSTTLLHLHLTAGL
jgi:hypothetical protein